MIEKLISRGVFLCSLRVGLSPQPGQCLFCFGILPSFETSVIILF